jgi:hypothetical protein
MTDGARDNPEHWADRRPRRDGAAAPVTSGARAGTSGAWRAAGAWLLVAALLGLVTFVNVMTIMDDARRRGVRLPLALPLTLELTSAVAGLSAATIIWFAVRAAPPGCGPLWRIVAVHAGGSLAFSGAHVGLMTLLRTALFAMAGGRYDWSFGELPYEYRKDLVTYVVVAALFWLLSRSGPATADAGGDAASAPATFDIRDGASILRVAVGEILAARGAGNYVEFALEDGRRPLMRASLGAVEAQLAPHGFLRTHRSWLVNAGRVREVAAAGSGDFRLDLGCGLTAPLSRRYPEALATLKREPQI